MTQVGPGTPGGEMLRRVLVADRVQRPCQGPAHEGRAARPGFRPLPQWQGHGRHARPALPASSDLARIWPGRGARHPLLSSRLALRARRQMPRNADRAAGKHLQGPLRANAYEVEELGGFVSSSISGRSRRWCCRNTMCWCARTASASSAATRITAIGCKRQRTAPTCRICRFSMPASIRKWP